MRSSRLSVLLLITLALTGCNNAREGAGFLNPNPGTGSSERPSERTDLPGARPGSSGETLGTAVGAGNPVSNVTTNMDPQAKGLVGSDTGGTGTNGGTGARNGGRGGSDAAVPQTPGDSHVQQASPEASTGIGVRDTPTRIEAPAGVNAQGETKPPGNINSGTPRSPQ